MVWISPTWLVQLWYSSSHYFRLPSLCFTLPQPCCCEFPACHVFATWWVLWKGLLNPLLDTPNVRGHLRKAVLDTKPASNGHMLKELRGTRWVQHIDAIEVFTNPLLPALRVFVMMVQAAGPQIHLQMREACYSLSAPLTPLCISHY